MAPKKKQKDEIEKLQEEVKQEASTEILEKDNAEVISKKKVIYIEIDDEVTAVYEKMKNVNQKHIYIVAPQRAILFQSIVNLKIIKRKAADDEKVIYIITNDKNGIYLAQQVGIAVYDKISSNEDSPSLFSTEVNDDKLRITPIKATINSVEEELPTRLSERKLSISEILRRRKGSGHVEISKVEGITTKKMQKPRPKFVLVAPNRHALVSLVVASIFILLVIIYIAIPGVTIYVTPSASVIEKSVNIVLADYQKNKNELDNKIPHMIASYPIDITVTKEITYTSTGKKFSENNINASGQITIYNTTNAVWPLIPNTRFQTDEGLVFRINDYVNVPAAGAAGPGKTEAFVVADPVDAYGNVVGEKGNVKPTKFFLPGLKGDSRSKVYAENPKAMEGGRSDFVTFVSPEDITAADGKVRDEVQKEALKELKLAVAEKSRLVGKEGSFVLLEGDGAIKLGEVQVTVPPNLEEQNIKEFKVTANVSVKGVYYDKSSMIEILKNELLVKKSPQKELIRINEDSSSYRIFEWDENTGKIKLTANIKGIEQFAITEETESGERLLKKIREHVAGQDIEKAKQYIQNLPEVNKVEIESWPLWSPTIPNLPDNIEFEVREAVKVE